MFEEKDGRYHIYHAEAGVLHASLQLPLAQKIKPQAFNKLPEGGGYLSQHARDYQLEGVMSFRSAYTQVAGNPDVKPGHGFSTVTTSVIEDLNILDVVTCDRIVAQISSEHPIKGYVPQISFLGTRFENLRIAGHKVHLDLDHDIIGPRAEDDSAYTSSKGLLERLATGRKCAEAVGVFPDEELAEFEEEEPTVEDDSAVEDPDYSESVEGSLVSNCKVETDDDSYPGKCSGNVIDVPNFGKIYLASLHLKHKAFQRDNGIPKQTTVGLKMMKLKMGCFAAGAMAIGSTRTNGGSHP